MTVRAKFKVDKVEATLTRRQKNPQGSWADDNMETAEIRTVVMSPVGANSPENKQFWTYTPTGRLELGTINPEAWSQFVLGKEYYIDFTPAEA